MEFNSFDVKFFLNQTELCQSQFLKDKAELIFSLFKCNLNQYINKRYKLTNPNNVANIYLQILS